MFLLSISSCYIHVADIGMYIVNVYWTVSESRSMCVVVTAAQVTILQLSAGSEKVYRGGLFLAQYRTNVIVRYNKKQLSTLPPPLLVSGIYFVNRWN